MFKTLLRHHSYFVTDEALFVTESHFYPNLIIAGKAETYWVAAHVGLLFKGASKGDELK